VNRNTVWARVLVEELVRSGVTDVCMAPGSRSTPLVLAAARQEGVRLRVFIDERSAAFFALGLGRATARPAAVLTTSGTAVANLLPAVVEASQSEVPLLVLSADRPPHLRDADANQTIDQTDIFGRFVRWSAELAPPEVDDRSLRHLRVQACRAVAHARGLPGGPVHLDVPFAKPLEPVEVAGDVPAELAEEAPGAWRGRSAEGGAGADGAAPPFTRIGLRCPRLDEDALAALARRLGDVERGVVVAGPHPEGARLGPAVRDFALASGFILLADPLSGARWPSTSPEVTSLVAHDLWLSSDLAAARLAPELVIRVGATPTSASLQRWLSRRCDTPQLVIDAGHRYKDHLAVAHEVVPACPVDTLTRVTCRLPTPGAATGSWREQWSAVDRRAVEAVREFEPDILHEGRIARALVETLPATTPLFVSSSMPVRDVDGYGGGRDRPLAVHGNRGASGIDGIVSTALGVAAGAGTTVVALVGDLAFLHDVNGLLATREPDADVVFVVVNNDGGGIFHMLPVAEHEPEFTPYFATPHGVQPQVGAALYGVPHRRVESTSDLVAAVEAALKTAGSEVVEIRTDRALNERGHAQSRGAAGRAAEAVLRGDPRPSREPGEDE
jgi:2-succinyl-5-enolpyruvyl-6-hydroxy-3-cyclohexene-1-carboxylate synthase